MTGNRIPLIIALLAFMCGALLGYGIRGAGRTQNTAPDTALTDMISKSAEGLTAQMNKNKSAIDDLSLRVYFLRKKLDESLKSRLESAELNEDVVDDLTRQIHDLGRRLIRPPDKRLFQQARAANQDMQPVRKITPAQSSPPALSEPLAGQLDFEFGSSFLSRSSEDRLDALLSSLSRGSDVSVDITAYIDADSEADALRKKLFMEKLKIQKLKDMIINGLPPVPLDDVIVAEKEYGKYLGMAYENETFSKPTTILGLPKSLSPREMEDLINANISVSDEDLESVASRRASAVKEYVMSTGKVEPDRIVSRVEPSLPDEQDTNTESDSAVLKIVLSP